MSGTAVMENPMLASSVSVSVAAPSASASASISPRDARTVPSLGRLVGRYTNNVPYPLLFVAGAAFGILFASLIVLFTHSSKTYAPKVSANAVVAPPVATWQPNVVVIHPAPVDPPMFDTPYVADPPAVSAPVQARPAAPAKKPIATRAPVRRQGKPANGNLLSAAL